MVYLFLADGFEEIEALATYDVLLRAKANIKTVSITDNLCVKGTHNIEVKADLTINDINAQECTCVILPGGMPGTTNLENCPQVINTVKAVNAKGLPVCAICAAPSVLGHLGLLNGKKATCFPGFEKDLTGAVVTKKTVQKSGNIITGKGAGAAIEFGLKIAEELFGKQLAKDLYKNMQCK